MAPADGKTPRSRTGQRAVRGVGLTQRIFEALVKTSNTAFEALPSSYVPAIKQHVTPRFMAIVYCPVVVELESGVRRVLYIDPLDVRDFRSEVREELINVQEKRHRCLKRITQIRDSLPRVHPRLAQERIQREVENAKEHAVEPLVQGLPSGINQLWVFIEVSSHMVQLELVCQKLKTELPRALEANAPCMVCLTAVGLREPHQSKGQKDSATELQRLELRDASSDEARQALEAWLEALKPRPPADEKKDARSKRGSLAVKDKGQRPELLAPIKGSSNSSRPASGSSSKSKTSDTEKKKPSTAKGRAGGGSRRLELAEALGQSIIADVMAGNGGAALVIACSPPSDAEACEALLRRSKMELFISGVLGASPEDPETAFEGLVNAAAPGSKLHLWFGPDYWKKFAEARQRQLDFMQAFNPELKEERLPDEAAKLSGEVIGSEMLEIRLLERIMRECYVDEQRCEEELTCLNRILAKSLFDGDEIKEALKPIKDQEEDTFMNMASLIGL